LEKVSTRSRWRGTLSGHPPQTLEGLIPGLCKSMCLVSIATRQQLYGGQAAYATSHPFAKPLQVDMATWTKEERLLLTWGNCCQLLTSLFYGTKVDFMETGLQVPALELVKEVTFMAGQGPTGSLRTLRERKSPRMDGYCRCNLVDKVSWTWAPSLRIASNRGF